MNDLKRFRYALCLCCLLILGGWSSLPTDAQIPDIDLSFRFSAAINWQESGYKVAISPRGDNHIYILDNSFNEIAILDTGNTDAANDLEWSPDGQWLAAALSGEDSIQIWDTNEFTLLKSLDASFLSGPLKWSPDGKVLAVLSYGDIMLWDMNSAEITRTIPVLKAGALEFEWNPDGTQIVAASELGDLRVWDVITGALLFEKVSNYGSENTSIFYSSIGWEPDGIRLAAYNIMNQTFEFWDIAQGKLLSTFRGSGETLRDEEHIIWGKGGFVSFDWQDRVKLWDLETGEVLKTFQLEGNIEKVKWNPDGTELFVANVTEGGIQDAITIIPEAQFDILALSLDTPNHPPIACPPSGNAPPIRATLTPK